MKLAAAVPLAALLALAACSSSQSSSDQTLNDYRTQGPVAGANSPNFVPSSTKESQTDNVAVNAYLWRGTLDTLSFMPLVSADPFGGVIITDWYMPPGIPNERFKATIYILGRELRSDNLRVSVFRQTGGNGAWQDSTVDPTTNSGIEDKILARARELRAAAGSNG